MNADYRPGYAERVRPSAIWTALDREQSSCAPDFSVCSCPFPVRSAKSDDDVTDLETTTEWTAPWRRRRRRRRRC